MRGWDRDRVYWNEVLDTIVEDGEDIHREYPAGSFGEKDMCGVYSKQTNQVNHMSLNRYGNVLYMMAPSETCNALYLMAPSLVTETCNVPYLMYSLVKIEICIETQC